MHFEDGGTYFWELREEYVVQLIWMREWPGLTSEVSAQKMQSHSFRGVSCFATTCQGSPEAVAKKDNQVATLAILIMESGMGYNHPSYHIIYDVVMQYDERNCVFNIGSTLYVEKKKNWTGHINLCGLYSGPNSS